MQFMICARSVVLVLQRKVKRREYLPEGLGHLDLLGLVDLALPPIDLFRNPKNVCRDLTTELDRKPAPDPVK